jgi:hypothetical protein
MASSRKSGAIEQAGLHVAEVVSFLRDTRSFPTRTEKEFAAALNLSSEEAKQTLPVLQRAGYIEPLEHGKWRSTEQGELVGGGKTPRFTRESVERALADLKERIQTINADESPPYRVIRAVAFGDLLGDRVRVQAATVGIELKGRSGAAGTVFEVRPVYRVTQTKLMEWANKKATVYARCEEVSQVAMMETQLNGASPAYDGAAISTGRIETLYIFGTLNHG